MDEPCPCGSAAAYAACCGPCHQGTPATTAEALMRSRYAAFVKRDAAYLLRTSHPLLRARLRMPELQASMRVTWLGLTVLTTTAGGLTDDRGEVHFQARFRARGRDQILEERSRFVRVGGEWLYQDDRGTT